MTMTFQEYYIEKISNIVGYENSKKGGTVFVILGQTSLWAEGLPTEFIVDSQTLGLEDQYHVFDEEWAESIISALLTEKEYHILSYAQLCYLQQHVYQHVPFYDRITIIEDNLRKLFPLASENFLEEIGEENIARRPKNLPPHHIEQSLIEGEHYYSVSDPGEEFRRLPMFVETANPILSDQQDMDVIDLGSDPLALDLFFNRCISSEELGATFIVRRYGKQPIDDKVLDNLKRLNAVFKHFGGELLVGIKNPLGDLLSIQPPTQALLQRYWGKDAMFRTLAIYQNPDQNNETIYLSQGIIVETIISEYKNAKHDKKSKDVFLTAPTGAGKSLIFQLPAFYVSAQKDVTIIVSPLIALMKDQVNAILAERHFEKVAYINGELSLVDRENVIDRCKAGDIDILYLSPELLLSYDIAYFIGGRKLGLVVVDEAHLITTWGRDFRVDYWFLGDYLHKLRVQDEYRFVLVAVTATAVYGGANDMVFDSIDSLKMQDPHMFIGQVKRDDITFAIHNYESFPTKYESRKLQQTVAFIKQAHEVGLRTLVYTPYTRHITEIMDMLNREQRDVVTGYHGGMAAEIKEFAFRQFKSGKKNIMLSTKAFGMGVDIADIELIYHHAPSGLLMDYVQEIGRAARKPGVRGFAAINYAPEDLGYSKSLYHMSAIRPYQVTEVLRKIHLAYKTFENNRNLVLSVDDFEYIFDIGQDLTQKVLTTLMMIEKDYLARYRYPVMVARPKKRYAQSFAKISEQDLLIYESKYPDTYRTVSVRKNGDHIIQLELDKIWEVYFNEQSFTAVKSAFYDGNLFEADGIDISPQLKISFERLNTFGVISGKLQRTLESVRQVLASMEGVFSAEDFEHKLAQQIGYVETTKKLADFLLAAYSYSTFPSRKKVANAFLQRRGTKGGYRYTALMDVYVTTFTGLMNRLNHLFGNTEKRTARRFVSNKRTNADNYVKLGYLLEILGLATFEVKGGQSTLVYIRLNDPARLEKDMDCEDYSNTLVANATQRHELNNRLFNHFFLNAFSNNDRWGFIEDFFLGEEVGDLFRRYPGTELNNLDIRLFLEENINPEQGDEAVENLLEEESESVVEEVKDESSNLHIFHATSESVFSESKLLTIENEDGIRTMRISEWLMHDPVALDTHRRQIEFKMDNKTYGILMSKLRANHFEYFRNCLRLQMAISFKGYTTMVKAVLPYTDYPVEFYKWWCENPDQVAMSFREKIVLFDKVYRVKPKMLKSEHKKLIGK